VLFRSPVWVRASAFMDYGERYLEEPLGGLQRRAGLWGVGLAVSANVGNRFDVRLALGVPLIETPTTPAGNPRVLFTVGAQF
jgi:hemolysin activation/secretion protein